MLAVDAEGPELLAKPSESVPLEPDLGFWNYQQHISLFFLLFGAFLAGFVIFTFAFQPNSFAPPRYVETGPPTFAPTRKPVSNWVRLITEHPDFSAFGQPFEIPLVETLTLPQFRVVNPWGNLTATCVDDWLTHYVACATMLRLSRTNSNPKTNALEVIVIANYLSNLGVYGWGSKQKPVKIELFAELPKLEKNQKYFVCKLLVTHIWHGNEQQMERFLTDFQLRDDVIFSDLDIGDHIQIDVPRCNDIAEQIRPLGVTFPSENPRQRADRFVYQKKLTYLLVFRGSCSSHVRRVLSQIFAEKVAGEEDILLQWTMNCAPNVPKVVEPPAYHVLLGEAKFCLLPRGDRRWTYRLMDALEHGCIPVIIADGLSLPFEQFIPWEKISIRIPQQLIELGNWNKTLALEVKEIIISTLRRYSNEFIMEIQRRIHTIYMEYFADDRKRAIAGLHCVWRIFERRSNITLGDFPMKDPFDCESIENKTIAPTAAPTNVTS